MLGTGQRTIVFAATLGLAAAACATAAAPSSTTPGDTPTTRAAQSTTRITSIESSTDPRLEEIRALTTDLTIRRLRALYELDADALAELDGRPGFLQHDLHALEDGGLDFALEPTTATVPYKILEVFVDDGSCLVVRSRIDLTDALESFLPSQQIDVFWVDGDSARFAEIFAPGASEEDWGPICDEAR